VPSRPLGSGVELESQVVQLRNCLETLERRLEEELRSFLAISDKRLQVREEQLRGVGETLQASADAALEQLGRRVDVRLRELERAGMAPMALDEVWDCIKRLQNDCQDLDSKLRRATSTDEIAERFQEMERAQAQRLEDRLATQERRLSDYRVQLQGSNREFLQAIEHRCEMLEKNFWEGQSDRGDVVEAVFKRLAEAAPIRELHDEKINSSNYDKEVQRSRLAAAEAKLSKFAALESKVDFMESQMSQQLEEQAQQFRNVGELQQRLVQKLSATEASCQRVEAQGSVLQAKLQAQMEEDRDRHSSSFESMQLRLVQRLEEVEGRSSRYATRSEKDLVDNMTALAQKISEDNAAAQRQADKRLHSIEERCDQVVQMARVQMERGVQDLKVEAEATKNALEMDLHRAERFMQEMGSKISSQEAQLLRMSEMDVQRSRLETLESKVNEVQGEQRTLRDVKAIVDAHKLQADRRHGDLEISMTSLEEQLRGREQRRSNDVEEQRARYEGLESRLTEVQVGQVRQNTTLENLTATLTNLEPKTVGQIADMARLEQAILVLQQQQRNQSFATTMGSLDRSGVTEPASPTRASSPVGRRVEDRVRRLEDAVDLLPPRLQDRLRALENASGSSELRSSSAASAAVNAVAASLAPQLEELRTRLGLLGQQQGDLDSRLRRAESRERPAAHQPAMQEPVAQPAREPAVDSRNASPKNSPEISELEARLSRLEDHLLTLDSLDSSGMETSALPSGATLQVTLDCIGDSEEPISSSDIRSALQEVESVELLRVDFPDRDRAAVCWVSTGSGAAETRLRRLLEDSDSVLRQRLGVLEVSRVSATPAAAQAVARQLSTRVGSLEEAQRQLAEGLGSVERQVLNIEGRLAGSLGLSTFSRRPMPSFPALPSSYSEPVMEPTTEPVARAGRSNAPREADEEGSVRDLDFGAALDGSPPPDSRHLPHFRSLAAEERRLEMERAAERREQERREAKEGELRRKRQQEEAEEAERKIREEQERQRQQRKDEDERRKKEEEQDAREIAAQKKREQEQRMRDDEQRRKEADEKNRKEAEEARIKEAEEAEAEEKKRKEAEAQKKREAEEQMRKEAEEQERREAMEAEEQRKRQEAEEAEEARQAQQKAQEAKQKQLEAARAAAGVVQPKEHTPTSQAGAPKPGFEKRRARVTGLPPTARASARSKEEEIKKVFAAIDTTSSGALTLDDLQSFLCDFLGFGQAEVAAFHQRFGEGDAMSLEGFKKGYASLNPFTLTKRHKELIIRKSGSLSSAGLQALQLEELEDSEVYVCELTNTAYVDVCKRCAILIGPSETSVFVRDCEDCVFWIAAQQLRTRDCKRCSFFLYSKTEPVIESSEDLAFAPWSASYPCSKAHFEKLGFNPEKNLWNAIYDFSGKVGKCNWRILGLEETARLQIELEDPPPKPEPENPAAPLTYEALCAEPLESGESCGTSVGQIPQTRPALPAAPPMDFKEVQQIVVQDGGKLAALEQLVRLRRKDSSSQPSTPGALAMATLAGKTLMKAGGGSAEMEAVAKATPASASSALGMARLAGQTLMEAGGGSAETEAVAKATPASASSALGMARLAGQTLMEAGGGSAETEAVAKATPASASSALGMARLAGQTLMEAGTTVHGTMAVEEEDSSGDSPRPAPSKAPKPAAKPAAKPDAAQVRKLLGESSDEESEEAKPSTAPSASAALPKLSLGKAMPKPAVNRAHPVAVDSEEDDDSDIEEAMKKAAAAASASRTSPLGGSSAAKSAPTSLRLSPQSRAEASVPVVDDEDDDSGNDFDEDIDLPM
ncbi:unnamed protein product, partial [Effrenium voratum]